MTPEQRNKLEELNGKLKGGSSNVTTTKGGQKTGTQHGRGLQAELVEQETFLQAARSAIAQNDPNGAIGQAIKKLPRQKKDEDTSTYVTVFKAFEGRATTEMVQVFSIDGYTSTVLQENHKVERLHKAEVDRLTAEVKKIKDEITKIEGDVAKAEEQKDKDDAKKRGEAQEPTAAGDERKIQDQCFLLANYGKIKANAPSRYSNFTVITGDTNLVVNALTSKKDGQALLDADPEVFSALQPLIRFTKVFLNDSGKPTGKGIEFPFGTKSFSPKEMLKDHRREAGIEAFTYAFQGQDFVTADTHLKCTAKFYFKTMKGFIDEQKHKDKSISFSDLASYTTSGPEGNYLIKADIGWADPGVVGSAGNNVVYTYVRDAIRNTRISLWLEPQSFSYSFNDDGSVSVDVTYVGAIYSMLRDNNFDIFRSTRSSSNFKTLQIQRLNALLDTLRKIKNLMKSRGLKEITEVKETELRGFAEESAVKFYRHGSSNDVDRVLNDLLLFGTKRVPTTENLAWSLANWFGWWGEEKSIGSREIPTVIDDTIKDVSDRISLLTSNSKYNRWKRLLTRVLNGGGIWKAIINQSDYTTYQEEYRNGTLATQGRDRYAQSRRAFQGKLKVERAVEEKTDKGKIHSAVAKKYKSVLGTGDAPMPIVGSGPLTSAGTYEITFIYFGALVNAALKVMEDVRDTSRGSVHNKVEFLLGPIDLPALGGGTRTVSLADVPISLDLFLQFFVNDIIEGDRSQYNVVDFMTNLLNKLLIPALGEMCFDISNKKMVIKQVLARATDIKVGASGDNNVPRIKRNTRVSAKKLREQFKNAKFTDRDPKNLRYYMLIYSADQNVSKRLQHKEGEESFNQFRGRLHGEGIYTLQTGRDIGLVDNVSFSMSKQQYVQEARVMSAAHKGLHIDHNADISLIGNTIFTNGMMIYLDPNYIGTGGFASRKELQQQLRIGGFYVVTRVEGTIGITGFQTKLQCIYQNT